MKKGLLFYLEQQLLECIWGEMILEMIIFPIEPSKINISGHFIAL